jgi:hypothetical protein
MPRRFPQGFGMPSKRKTVADAQTEKLSEDSYVPTENEAVLAELDRLSASDAFHPFIEGKPDNVDPLITWDVIGDDDRNWLFAVARKEGRRYAMIDPKPRGWPIRGQLFGIDAGTADAAMDLADAISVKYPEVS